MVTKISQQLRRTLGRVIAGQPSYSFKSLRDVQAAFEAGLEGFSDALGDLVVFAEIPSVASSKRKFWERRTNKFREGYYALEEEWLEEFTKIVAAAKVSFTSKEIREAWVKANSNLHFKMRDAKDEVNKATTRLIDFARSEGFWEEVDVSLQRELETLIDLPVDAIFSDLNELVD